MTKEPAAYLGHLPGWAGTRDLAALYSLRAGRCLGREIYARIIRGLTLKK